MPKTVTATEAKNNFGSIAEWVMVNHDAVLVENRGTESVVIISNEDYAEYLGLKRQQRRDRVAATLRMIQEEGAERNRDLSEEEAMELAVQVVREVRADMAAEQTLETQQTGRRAS